MVMVHEENAVAVNYHGIVIYHVYKDNCIDGGVRDYWYSTNPYGYDDDEDTFDIRDMPCYDWKANYAVNLIKMIDAGVFGETVKREDGDYVYSSAESELGRCPVCGAKIKDYKSRGLDAECAWDCFECDFCGIEGSAWYKLTFDGFITG